MSLPRSEITASLFKLAQSRRFFSAADLCQALNISHEECEELLETYAAEGLLRRCESSAGPDHYYFWINTPPSDLDADRASE